MGHAHTSSRVRTCTFMSLPCPHPRGQKKAEGSVVRLLQGGLWSTAGRIRCGLQGVQTAGHTRLHPILLGETLLLPFPAAQMLAARSSASPPPWDSSEMQSPREKASNCNLFGVLETCPPHSGSTVRHDSVQPAAQHHRVQEMEHQPRTTPNVDVLGSCGTLPR